MKKPSAAKRHKPPVFFVDRSLGKFDVPDALRAAGYRCELHDNHFGETTPDTEWLNAIAQRGWVVLTKDERIRYRPQELQALVAARLRAFIVVSGNLRGVDTAAVLLKAMPKILAALASAGKPFIYYVYKDSTIRHTR